MLVPRKLLVEYAILAPSSVGKVVEHYPMCDDVALSALAYHLSHIEALNTERNHHSKQAGSPSPYIALSTPFPPYPRPGTPAGSLARTPGFRAARDSCWGRIHAAMVERFPMYGSSVSGGGVQLFRSSSAIAQCSIGHVESYQHLTLRYTLAGHHDTSPAPRPFKGFGRTCNFYDS